MTPHTTRDAEPTASAAPAGSSPGRSRVSTTGPLWIVPLALVLVTGPGPLSAQGTASMVGRTYDAVTREPVQDVTLRIQGVEAPAVTDMGGGFRMEGIPADGPVVLEMEHPAYGPRTDTVSLEAGEALAVRIFLARKATPLKPVTVEVATREDRRRSGTPSDAYVITRPELEELAGTSRSVVDVLEREIPGMRVSRRGTAPARFCLEFRSVARSLQRDPDRCSDPLLMLDRSRVDERNTGSVLESLSLEDVQRIEVVRPAEAGLQYGTGSQNGVLLVETRVRTARPDRSRDLLSEVRPRSTYNWNLEPEDHHTLRSFGAAAAGNAAGLALGLWLGSRCIDYDVMHMDFFHSRCGGLTTLGVRLAAIGLPLAGSTLASRWAGATRASQGDWKKSAGVATIVLIPGYIMAATGLGEEGSGAQTAGKIMVSLGVPLMSAVADRLFRDFRFQR